MDKTEFFKTFHKSLTEKYALPSGYIETIRSYALGNNMDRLEIMDTLDNKLRIYKKNKQTPRQKWKDLFNFLENFSDEAFADITQKTKWDKTA